MRISPTHKLCVHRIDYLVICSSHTDLLLVHQSRSDGRLGLPGAVESRTCIWDARTAGAFSDCATIRHVGCVQKKIFSRWSEQMVKVYGMDRFIWLSGRKMQSGKWPRRIDMYKDVERSAEVIPVGNWLSGQDRIFFIVRWSTLQKGGNLKILSFGTEVVTRARN